LRCTKSPRGKTKQTASTANIHEGLANKPRLSEQ
jgi:hypothetical protein